MGWQILGVLQCLLSYPEFKKYIQVMQRMFKSWDEKTDLFSALVRRWPSMRLYLVAILVIVFGSYGSK